MSVSDVSEIHLEVLTLPSEGRFEASGLARIGGTELLLVVNDKGKRDPADRLALLGEEAGALTVKGRLAPPAGQGGVPPRGYEDAAASLAEPGVVYAVTSFGASDKPEKRNLQRLVFGPRGQLVASADVPIADPEAAPVGYPYLNVEALALSPEEETLYLGARCWGPRKSERVFGVLILGYERARPERQPTRLAQVDLAPLLGRPEGLAGMEYAPALDGYLVITSFESETQLGGHLWLAPEDVESLADPRIWSTLPRIALPNKPEGVALDPEGRILVVFDPDKERKKASGLAPNQALYARIPASALTG